MFRRIGECIFTVNCWLTSNYDRFSGFMQAFSSLCKHLLCYYQHRMLCTDPGINSPLKAEAQCTLDVAESLLQANTKPQQTTHNYVMENTNCALMCMRVNLFVLN